MQINNIKKTICESFFSRLGTFAKIRKNIPLARENKTNVKIFWSSVKLCVSVDGAWAQWSAFGSCSVTCGGGTYSRSRTCSDPAPANGGLNCTGDSADYGDCNTTPCPTVAAGAYQQVYVYKLCRRHHSFSETRRNLIAQIWSNLTLYLLANTKRVRLV